MKCRKPHVCHKCGKCCYRFGITFSSTDVQREPRLHDVLIGYQDVTNPKTRRFMRERQHPFAIAKVRRGNPCPFLFPNNECMIYTTRPQVCRDFPGDGPCVKEHDNGESIYGTGNHRDSTRPVRRQ